MNVLYPTVPMIFRGYHVHGGKQPENMGPVDNVEDCLKARADAPQGNCYGFDFNRDQVSQNNGI